MNDNIKRAIILENYQNPKNRGLTNDSDYEKISTNSKSCIDQIDLEMKVKDGIIEDIKFDGEACAICTSSTSIMTDTLIGKDLDSAIDIIDNFKNMIEKKYSADKIGEAIVYSDISKQKKKKNCALLTWRGAADLIERIRRN